MLECKRNDVENDIESELHHINQKASSEPLFCADHFIKKECITGFTERKQKGRNAWENIDYVRNGITGTGQLQEVLFRLP